MNGLACATFFGFYMMYKYLFLWQFQQSESNETGGLFYPKAMQHVFVGLYINQVCMLPHVAVSIADFFLLSFRGIGLLVCPILVVKERRQADYDTGSCRYGSLDPFHGE